MQTTSGKDLRARPVNVAYSPALDGWRAISILLVVIGHGGMRNFVPGGMGVTIFFFISGFLITSLLLTEIERTNSISLKDFYLRRFWRLSPPVLVYIAITTIFTIIVDGYISPYEPLAALLYFANYYSFHWGFSFLSGNGSPLGILGSLAVEEHYYILFAPVVAFIAYSRIRLIYFIVLLLIVPLILRCRIIFGNDVELIRMGYTYMATETRIDSIAWGALLAWLCHFTDSGLLEKIFDRKGTVAVSFCILLLCLTVRAEWFRESFRYSLQGLAMLSIFYSSLRGDVLRWVRKVLESRVLILIGKMSYSTYLYHWFALIIANIWIGTETSSLTWLFVFYLLTVIFSYISYRLLEIPSMALRKKYGSHVAQQLERTRL